GFVRPVRVQTGLTDGMVTEIVSGELAEGSAVVTGVAQREAASSNGASPFAPSFRGKKSS
ncbi:MAG TPA: hypothetical protein VEL76_33295, partial [Gemmataceae bacterium]|nr:hypothetical protein [Gemmataceae bacterium]